MVTSYLSVKQLAERAGASARRVRYILGRDDIEPAATAGRIRLYTPEQAEWVSLACRMALPRGPARKGANE